MRKFPKVGDKVRIPAYGNGATAFTVVAVERTKLLPVCLAHPLTGARMWFIRAELTEVEEES